MANKSPAYRWYPRDILGSLRVAAMTAAEECWYRRALDFAWLNHGIPADPLKLSRIIGKNCTVNGAKAVLTMFQPSTDPEICISERQEIERRKQREWSEKSAFGGRKSKPNEKQKESKTEPPFKAKAKQKGTLKFEAGRDSSEEESCRTPQAAPKPRGSRIPNTFFVTNDMKTWVTAECPMVDWETETTKFCNHFRSVTGRNAVKLNWTLTWQNWMLNARDRYGGSHNRSKNGTSTGKSEREKSAERGANVDAIADQLRREALAEMEAVHLDDADNYPEVDQPGERSLAN